MLVPLLLCALLPSATARAEIPAELLSEPILEIEVAGEAAAIVTPHEVGIPLGRRSIAAWCAGAATPDRKRPLHRRADRRRRHARRRALIVWLTPRIVVHRLDIAGNQSLDTQSVREALGVGPGSEVSLNSSTRARRQGRQSLRRARLPRRTDRSRAARHRRPFDQGADGAHRGGHADADLGDPFRGRAAARPGGVRSSMSSAIGDILDRQKLNEDVQKAEAFLRRHGFLEAELSPPLVTIEGARAIVVIPSRIGPHYDVIIHGQAPFMPSEIADVLGLEQERLSRRCLAHTLTRARRRFLRAPRLRRHAAADRSATAATSRTAPCCASTSRPASNCTSRRSASPARATSAARSCATSCSRTCPKSCRLDRRRDGRLRGRRRAAKRPAAAAAPQRARAAIDQPRARLLRTRVQEGRRAHGRALPRRRLSLGACRSDPARAHRQERDRERC